MMRCSLEEQVQDEEKKSDLPSEDGIPKLSTIYTYVRENFAFGRYHNRYVNAFKKLASEELEKAGAVSAQKKMSTKKAIVGKIGGFYEEAIKLWEAGLGSSTLGDKAYHMCLHLRFLLEMEEHTTSLAICDKVEELCKTQLLKADRDSAVYILKILYETKVKIYIAKRNTDKTAMAQRSLRIYEDLFKKSKATPVQKKDVATLIEVAPPMVEPVPDTKHDFVGDIIRNAKMAIAKEKKVTVDHVSEQDLIDYRIKECADLAVKAREALSKEKRVKYNVTEQVRLLTQAKSNFTKKISKAKIAINQAILKDLENPQLFADRGLLEFSHDIRSPAAIANVQCALWIARQPRYIENPMAKIKYRWLLCRMYLVQGECAQSEAEFNLLIEEWKKFLIDADKRYTFAAKDGYFFQLMVMKPLGEKQFAVAIQGLEHFLHPECWEELSAADLMRIAQVFEEAYQYEREFFAHTERYFSDAKPCIVMKPEEPVAPEPIVAEAPPPVVDLVAEPSPVKVLVERVPVVTHRIEQKVSISPVAADIVKKLKRVNPLVFIVGGKIRDQLKENKQMGGDLDVVTGVPYEKIVAVLGEFYDIEKAKKQGLCCIYPKDTKIKNKKNKLADLWISEYFVNRRLWPDPFKEDALHRNFTVNTVYADKEGNVYAPIPSALDDLKYNYLTVVERWPGFSAKDSFKEDFTRIFSALDFAINKGFNLSDDIVTAIRSSWDLVPRRGRIVGDEGEKKAEAEVPNEVANVNAWIYKLFSLAKRGEMFTGLFDLGGISALFPELAMSLPVLPDSKELNFSDKKTQRFFNMLVKAGEPTLENIYGCFVVFVVMQDPAVTRLPEGDRWPLQKEKLDAMIAGNPFFKTQFDWDRKQEKDNKDDTVYSLFRRLINVWYECLFAASVPGFFGKSPFTLKSRSAVAVPDKNIPTLSS